MVETPEAIWVLYRFNSLLRVCSSMIDEDDDGFMAADGVVDKEEKAACPECSFGVIPGCGSFGATV